MKKKTFREYLISRRFKATTINHYCQIIGRYEAKNLSTENISSTWRLQVKAALRAYANYLYEIGKSKKQVRYKDLLCDSNIMDVVYSIPQAFDEAKMPKEPLSDKDFNKLAKEFKKIKSTGFKAIYNIMLLTGLRVSDVGRIEKTRILEAKKSKSGVIILQPKGRKFKKYPWKILKPHLEPLLTIDEKWDVLYDLIDRRWDEAKHPRNYARNKVYKRLKIIARDAGVDPKQIHPHKLRHTVVHQIYRQKKDLKAVKDILLHASIATSQLYVDDIEIDMMLETFEEVQRDRGKK